MSTSSPKIPHISNREIFQLNLRQNDEKYEKSGVVQIQAVFGTV